MWNVGSAPMLGATPPVESALSAAAASGASGAQPDNVDLLLEAARRQLAAVRLPAAPWGPGSSLSPRSTPVVPPTSVHGWAAPPFGADAFAAAFPAAAPVAQGKPQERSLIDL